MIVDHQNAFGHEYNQIKTIKFRRSSARQAALALLLATLWLTAYRFADILTMTDNHASLWFLPAGVIMATVLVAPGWLKAVPLLTHLLLVIPPVRALFGIGVANEIEFAAHGIRLYAIYGGAAFLLVNVAKVSLPIRRWRDVQWFLAIALTAATLGTFAGISMYVLAGRMTIAAAAVEANTWWLGDALGAVMLPPILVPILMRTMGQSIGEWRWPSARWWLFDLTVIVLAAVVGALGPSLGLNLWYSLIPPALIFALYGGYERGAAAVLLTCLLAPIIAQAFATPEQISALQSPLLTMAVAALLIGAATTDRARTAERLKALVAQRTEELEKAYNLQRHLVRSLGHDLRQPMEAINLTLDGLANQPERLAGPNVQRLRTLGAMASDLLTRILIYARLDTGEIKPELSPFSSCVLIERLKTLYDPQAERRSVEIDWPVKEHTIISDRELLFQVLSNLLDNAIRLSAAGSRVGVGIEETASSISLVVTDTIAPTAPRKDSTAGLGLRIIAQVSLLLGATVIDQPNRKGINLPPMR